jgi:conjugal transfer pilin signal peptidase TrbI
MKFFREAKKPWPEFLIKCLAVLAVFVAGGSWLFSRYFIVIAHGQLCLPGRLFLVEKQEVPGRNDLVAFLTDERPRPYKPGTGFVKLVRGLPGDKVDVDGQCRFTITGGDGYEYHGELEPQVVALLQKKCADFKTHYQIPPQNYFVMGMLPDSYDSRYWGLVSASQVIGKAAKLF